MALQEPRQAGAEIEVTEEMIEAGVAAICQLDLLSDPFADMAEAIFRAMAAVRARPGDLVFEGNN